MSVLRQGGLHEIKPHAYRDTPAGLGLALSAIAEIQAQDPGLVLWCMTRLQAQEWGRPYGPGLVKAGLDPARFLIVETRSADEAAWALEEGLKSAALSACLAQTEIKTPLTARRLGLAARAAGIPCFLLTGHGETNIPGTLTRWRIATEGSAHVPFDTGAPGTACWRLSLERSRAGTTRPQVAQRAVGRTTRPQAGQRPVGQIESSPVREGARFHVQTGPAQTDRVRAGHESERQNAGRRAQTALRVASATPDRTADAGELAPRPYGATG
ncbi:MAG: hypothetical protein A49_03830 [Methyloceanibacter sp.]|nr:MAG: hypothetical protein A49_03830 [Methyloceanibacter sp.]